MSSTHNYGNHKLAKHAAHKVVYTRVGQPVAHAPCVAHWLLKSGALHLFDDKPLLLTNFFLNLPTTDIFQWKTEHQRA